MLNATKDKYSRTGERKCAGQEDIVSDKVLEGSQDPHLIAEIDVVREWVTWLPGGKLFQVEGQQMPGLCCTDSRARNKASTAFPFLRAFPLEFILRCSPSKEPWISGARKSQMVVLTHLHSTVHRVCHLLLPCSLIFCLYLQMYI